MQPDDSIETSARSTIARLVREGEIKILVRPRQVSFFATPLAAEELQRLNVGVAKSDAVIYALGDYNFGANDHGIMPLSLLNKLGIHEPELTQRESHDRSPHYTDSSFTAALDRLLSNEVFAGIQEVPQNKEAARMSERA